MERRTFVESMAAGLAGAWGVLRWSELTTASAFAATLPDAAPYEYLTPDQVRVLDTITSHLVPTDDTPGAREAHVVRFIDHALATFWTEHRKEFAGVLGEFTAFTAHYRPDNVPFLELSPSEQVAALRDVERLKPDVFRTLREVTMVGMFAHPEHGGNYRKIGWKLIGYVDQYSWAPPFGYYDRS